MGFIPASCDNNCKGCEKNSCGWCTWKDRATPYYKTEAFKAMNEDLLRKEELANYIDAASHAKR